MKLNSIQVKLAVIIALGFALTTALVVFIVDQKMTTAINISQEAEYGEKLQRILRIIQINQDRLQKTEMVSTYQEDFQVLTLRQLKATYSQPSSQGVSPFVVNDEGKMLLAPIWPVASTDLYSKDLVELAKGANGKSFTYSLPDEGEAWCIFRWSKSWGWTVGYMVPLDVKYRMADQLRKSLLWVFGSITLLVVALLFLMVRFQLRPITALTKVSAEMAQGNLESQIVIESNDEVGMLADNFNRMQVAIQQTIESLRQSEERLSLALIGGNSGIWDWNLKSGDVYFDDNYFRLIGYEPDEFPHSFDEWRIRVHPEDIEHAEAEIKAYLAGNIGSYAVEFRFRTKQGDWVWIHGQGRIFERDEAGQPVRFTGTHTDISVRKKVEEALRRSEGNLRTTLDSIGDAVISTDAETRITRMNPVAEALTGWADGEAIGHPLDEVFRVVHSQTRENIGNLAQKVLDCGEIIGLADDVILIARNGSEHEVADSGAPIRNEYGEIAGVVLVFRDVTQERALQVQVQQSHKMDTIGQLAGGVAHDFNNMLGGIIGATELLERLLPDDPKTNKFLSIIMESAERAADLTTKLLAFARKQHVSSTPVDAHLALGNAVSLLENTVDRRVQITTKLAAESTMVVGDLTQLQNVFLNLCINASQAMPEGGNLSISTQVVELDEIFCNISVFDLCPGEYLEVEIRDDGCGISSENMDRIFEPFFTTKEQGKGTGLGLAAVFGTVQQHHGAVAAYSEVGIGSVFSVLLPLTESSPVGVRPAVEVQTGTGLILVVDDETVMRATAAAILEDLGYEVLLAENGQVGFEIFREKHHEIDLVVLDMIMPEMNGRDCFVEMRKVDPEAKILISSGFTRDDELSDLRAVGLAGFIRKPYRGVVLSQMVSVALSVENNNPLLWSG